MDTQTSMTTIDLLEMFKKIVLVSTAHKKNHCKMLSSLTNAIFRHQRPRESRSTPKQMEYWIRGWVERLPHISTPRRQMQCAQPLTCITAKRGTIHRYCQWSTTNQQYRHRTMVLCKLSQILQQTCQQSHAFQNAQQMQGIDSIKITLKSEQQLPRSSMSNSRRTNNERSIQSSHSQMTYLRTILREKNKDHPTSLI